MSPSSSAALGQAASDVVCPRIRHILSGSFNTVFLHLLTFDSLTRALNVVLSVPAQGPHQWLALGSIGVSRSSNTLQLNSPRTVYATTWADERRLSAWRVNIQHGAETIEHINSQPIIAAGSYLSVQPPPHDSRTSPAYGVESFGAHPDFLYQAGGPTGEVFRLNPTSGAIEDKVQQLIFLRGGQAELDAGADTGRKGLRYGAHNIDFDIHGLGYVADLGRNAILVYSRNPTTGQLELKSENPSPKQGDGPRHVVPSHDGRWVFSVTEHTSYVDAYRVDPVTQTLSFRQRASLLPPGRQRSDFRGDTVRLSPSGQHLFAATRGKTTSVRGWVGVWQLDLDDEDRPMRRGQKSQNDGDESSGQDTAFLHYETPTSGGKANAWEWAPRYPLQAAESLSTTSSSSRRSSSGRTTSLHSVEQQSLHNEDKDWAVLTDDEQGLVMVMEWDGEELREVARTQLPGKDPESFIPHSDGVKGNCEGASHAIWLS